MLDPFNGVAIRRESPALDCVPIVPSDSASLDLPMRAVRATTAGVIKLVTSYGVTRICAFTAGETRPIIVTKVFATGTTCTGIEGMV